MMITYKQFLETVSVCAISLIVCGCAHQRFADERAAYREQNVRNVADTYARREAESPRRLGETLTIADAKLKSDAAEFQADGPRAKAWFDYEFRRWIENQPIYQKHIDNQLRGHPDDIEPNTIILFW